MKRCILSSDSSFEKQVNSDVNKKYPGSRVCSEPSGNGYFDIYVEQLPGYEYYTEVVGETTLLKVPKGLHGQILVNVGCGHISDGTIEGDSYEGSMSWFMKDVDKICGMSNKLDNLYDKLEKCFDLLSSKYPDYDVEYYVKFTWFPFERNKFDWKFNSSLGTINIELDADLLELDVDSISNGVSSKVSEEIAKRDKKINRKGLFYKELDYKDRTDVSEDKGYSYYRSGTIEKFLEVQYERYFDDYNSGDTLISVNTVENSSIPAEELAEYLNLYETIEPSVYESTFEDINISQFDKLLRNALKKMNIN